MYCAFSLVLHHIPADERPADARVVAQLLRSPYPPATDIVVAGAVHDPIREARPFVSSMSHLFATAPTDVHSLQRIPRQKLLEHLRLEHLNELELSRSPETLELL